jgi:hypothetical protein
MTKSRPIPTILGSSCVEGWRYYARTYGLLNLFVLIAAFLLGSIYWLFLQIGALHFVTLIISLGFATAIWFGLFSHLSRSEDDDDDYDYLFARELNEFERAASATGATCIAEIRFEHPTNKRGVIWLHQNLVTIARPDFPLEQISIADITKVEVVAVDYEAGLYDFVIRIYTSHDHVYRIHMAEQDFNVWRAVLRDLVQRSYLPDRAPVEFIDIA